MSETGHRRTSRREADARGSRVGAAIARVVVIVLGAALTSFACALFAIGGEHLAHRRATDSFPEPGDPTELLLPLWGTAFVFGVLPALTVLPWTRVQRWRYRPAGARGFRESGARAAARLPGRLGPDALRPLPLRASGARAPAVERSAVSGAFAWFERRPWRRMVFALAAVCSALVLGVAVPESIRHPSSVLVELDGMVLYGILFALLLSPFLAILVAKSNLRRSVPVVFVIVIALVMGSDFANQRGLSDGRTLGAIYATCALAMLLVPRVFPRPRPRRRQPWSDLP